jgi:hypothetical protein
LPSYASGNNIDAQLKFKEFEMFEAGSQDFCSPGGPDKAIGFIDFSAVQHDFLSAPRSTCRRFAQPAAAP